MAHSIDIVFILTSYWLRAANALLGELLSEAVGAVRLLITRSKLLADQHLVAAGAREAFAMPRRTLVRDSSLVDHLNATKRALNHYVHFVIILVDQSIANTDSQFISYSSVCVCNRGKSKTSRHACTE